MAHKLTLPLEVSLLSQVYKFKDLGFLISVLTIARSTDVVAAIVSAQQFLPVIMVPLEEEKCQPKNEGSSSLAITPALCVFLSVHSKLVGAFILVFYQHQV